MHFTENSTLPTTLLLDIWPNSGVRPSVCIGALSRNSACTMFCLRVLPRTAACPRFCVCGIPGTASYPKFCLRVLPRTARSLHTVLSVRFAVDLWFA